MHSNYDLHTGCAGSIVGLLVHEHYSTSRTMAHTTVSTIVHSSLHTYCSNYEPCCVNLQIRSFVQT